MDYFFSVRPEASAICKSLAEHLPNQISAQEAILRMKNEGSPHWKQMEWIGWYFEHIVERDVRPNHSQFERGPRFGNTQFDLSLKHVWDLKVHLESTPTMILNDREAIEMCIEKHQGVGFIVVNATVEYDMSGTVKKWHDELKGGPSKYEQDRIAREAPSRRRKALLMPTSITAYWLPEASAIERGLQEKWLQPFQVGMRNSNGNPRREKVAMRPSRVPQQNVLAHIVLN